MALACIRVCDFFGTSCFGILAREYRLYSSHSIKKKVNSIDPESYIVTPNSVCTAITQGCVAKYTSKVPVKKIL